MYTNKLRELINKRIDILENKKIKFSKQQINLEKIDSLINLITNIQENYKDLINLDLEVLKKDFNIENKYLNFYQIIIKNNLELKESDIKNIKKILNELKEKITKEKQSLEKKYNKNQEIEKDIKKLQELIKKSENFTLDDSDIDIIQEILKDNKDLEESINIMKYLLLNSLKNRSNEEHEELSLKITNLDIKELTKLFNKYNLDFTKINKSNQKELQEYGNLENIESIIIILKKYKLLDEEIFYKYQTQINKILIYGSSEIVENVILIYKKYNINILDYLDDFYKRPAKFIKEKTRLISPTKKSNSLDTETIGGYEDFKKNIELFASLGVDINKSYKKSAYYFEKSHDHILTGIKNFELYGISSDKYLNTLSSFANHKQLDILDMFIELDAFEYVINNMSRVNLAPTSLLFYKLFEARKKGIKPESLYRGKNSLYFPNELTNDSFSFQGVSKDNYLDITNPYTERKPIYDAYDECIKKSNNNTIINSFNSYVKIIKLLDDNFIPRDDNNYPDMRLYNIDGIRISRMKVIRYISTLLFNGLDESFDMLMYAITKNSLLTSDEYKKIETSIYELLNEKKR